MKNVECSMRNEELKTAAGRMPLRPFRLSYFRIPHSAFLLHLPDLPVPAGDVFHVARHRALDRGVVAVLLE